jgi:hypothetical protein
MDKIMLFVSAVAAHWLFTFGGIAMVAFGLYEKYKHKETAKWVFWGFAVVLLLVAFYQAWGDEHSNSALLIEQKASAWSQFNQCDKERLSKSLLNDQFVRRIDSQQGIIDSQLSTVTSCIATLTKANLPEPLRITTRGVRINESQQNTRPTIILVAETNRIVPAFVGKIKCDAPFAFIQAEMIGGLENYTPAFKTQPRELHTELTLDFGTRWNPHDPIIALVQGAGLRPLGCSITSD